MQRRTLNHACGVARARESNGTCTPLWKSTLTGPQTMLPENHSHEWSTCCRPWAETTPKHAFVTSRNVTKSNVQASTTIL